MEMTNTAGTSTGTSPFGALFAMFYEPSKTFAALQPKRHAWLPLLLVMISSVILLSCYLNFVDIPWLADLLNSKVKDAAMREKAAAMMTKGVLQGIFFGSSMVMLPLMTVLVGVYFMLVAKFMGKEFSFGTGFALSAWSLLPSLLSLPLGIIQILMSSSNQLSPSELNPISINQLFFHYGMENKLTSPLDMLSLTTVLSIILMVVGFQAWANVSRATAVKVVVIPYFVIFASWIGIALAMSKAA